MKKFANFALAALATMTFVGVSAQERHGRRRSPWRRRRARRERLDGAPARDSRHVERRRSTRLRKRTTSAAELIASAYGHAVFDTTKGGFIVTGAGGTGVAMRKNGGDPVYMHLGAGGVGLGAGLENYKLIVLFENEDTYERFIDGAWTAGASAQAAAGRDGAARWQVRQRRCGLSRDRQGRDRSSRRDGREVLAERQAQPGRRVSAERQLERERRARRSQRRARFYCVGLVDDRLPHGVLERLRAGPPWPP